MSSISGSTSSLARAWALPLALAALAGCASLRTLELPEVRAADVRMVVFDFPRVRLAIDVTLENPNAVEIALSSVDIVLDVEGVPVARAALASPVTLAARVPTRVLMDATGDLSMALAGAARALARGGAPLRYEMVGSVQLRGGRRVPFRKAGVLGQA